MRPIRVIRDNPIKPNGIIWQLCVENKNKEKRKREKKMEIETPLLSVNCAASNEIFYQSSIVEQCSSLKKEESNGVYFVWTLD